MKKSSTTRILLVLFLAIAAIAEAQQPAKKDRSGNQVCVVRNDSAAPVTIEYRNSSSEWQQVKLDPSKDATITADHIRVATTREDKAIVTVDVPTQAGKKYRLFWNRLSNIWDFSPVL